MSNINQKKQHELNVSVIVPCNHDIEELKTLLFKISEGHQLPYEVIVIQSKNKQTITNIKTNKQSCEETNLVGFFNNLGILLKIIKVEKAFPGEARNLGVKCSKGELIAFLDVKTLPTLDWLKKACIDIQDANTKGVWGSVVYESNSFFSEIVLDVIYGRNPVQSIPGTVFKRECIAVVGQMVSWVPAGEDGDWIARVKVHRLNFKKPNVYNVAYTGLTRKNLIYFIKKWWNYYYLSRMIPINNRDRWLSYILGYIILMFLAFNWNYKISEYIFGTYIIVPHITKTVLIAGFMLYVTLRSFYLPLSRGVPLKKILPFRFINLIIVALILDFIKTLALLVPYKNTHQK